MSLSTKCVVLGTILSLWMGLLVAPVFSQPSRQQTDSVHRSTWPLPAREIRYLCAADNTLQGAIYYSPETEEAVPLLVGLHTWSGSYTQLNRHFLDYAVEQGWAMIHPDFRGTNSTPNGCGSDLAVADIVSAVEYVKSIRKVDSNRIYLMGASGGGYMTMLMVGRHPEIWAAASAWCGISDLTAWHHQTKSAKLSYASHLESACGGAPGISPEVDAQYKHRSAITWAKGAVGVPLSINHGIHDGHTGSVPVSHSLNFFNQIVPAEKRLSNEDIAFITEKETIPESLAAGCPIDPAFGNKKVVFRCEVENTQLTLFEGGHDCIPLAGLHWLARQRKGQLVDWSIETKKETTTKPNIATEIQH